eukprot:scaffold104984_cov31-Phaeocystis_antarctica.AAC.2
MALSSPARSPSLCIPWAKSVSVPWTGPPDTLAGRQLLSFSASPTYVPHGCRSTFERCWRP